ncbi:breast carcinoma-amplified sequence 1 isoform X2 [Echinops telfairi]|uniref:Breast carcinoma-amplified sequence 1 isoform X2 n=1 Tax=Echinops telfairi TaxID=9371 RepID=A0AC55DI32_ECHTE|nr:breast carcinoma-amplified sequence 1 isoform X2 [Echinops telfairi]
MLSYEVSVSRAGFDDSKFSELAGETVDLGIRVQADNAAASSPGTMEPSRVADAGGTGAKPEVPAARSRLFMTLSGPVPGRARDQASDSSAGSVRLNVSPKKGPGNKGPSESVPLPAAAAVPTAPDKTPAASGPRGPAPLPPEPEGAALSVPKDPGFFDKIFKLDKGREKTPVDSQADAPGVPRGDRADNVAGPAGPRSDDRGQQDVADSKEREGPEIASLDSSVLEGIPEAPETTAENPQATEPTESNHPIMSFFKTLVSPNKAEANKEPEDTAAGVERVCDGHAGQTTSEGQAKGAKKKHLDSPRVGLAFRKFFRHKGAEKSPPALADPKSDKANIVPQETQGAAKNPKGCSPVIPAPSAAASETAKDGPKERAGPTSLPLGKLFWKKSSKEDSIPTGSEENVVGESPGERRKSEDAASSLHTVDLSEDIVDAAPQPAHVKPAREESKPPRTLLAFFRQMSVKEEGGRAYSEGVNGKDPAHQTSDSTEKTPSPPEPEPEPTAAAPRGREGPSKEKKAAAEPNKQKSNKPEAKDGATSAEPCVVEADPLQNGDQRAERPRPSLRGFLKGLGPKRMLDAQVQTDPVSIGPVGKSK